MASESADPALSPATLSFIISGKTWKLGDAIYSIGVGAIKKKEMVALLDLILPQQGQKESSWAKGLGTNIV